MFGQPISLETLAKRVDDLERHNRALWSLLADAYAFRDEKNFADFIVRQMNDVGGCAIDARAMDRLQAMIARGPGGRGDPIQGS
jgi:hypothetical protein